MNKAEKKIDFTILFVSRINGSISEKYSLYPDDDSAFTFAPCSNNCRAISTEFDDKQPQAICKGVKLARRVELN